MVSGDNYTENRLRLHPESIRAFCLAWPGVTETIQFKDHLVLKVAGKIFVLVNLEGAGNAMSFKVAPEEFAELCEREGVVPAPYLARAKWIALEGFDVMPAKELKARLRQSYDLVVGKLPKKIARSLV